jgi:hypothetical protein
MPNLNIPIPDELMRGIRVRAAESDKTRREWLIENLQQAVEQPRPEAIECAEVNE